MSSSLTLGQVAGRYTFVAPEPNFTQGRKKIMADSLLRCRHTGIDHPYEIQVGLAPKYVLKLNTDWEAEKTKILQEMFAAYPDIADDNALFIQQVLAYGLADLGWRWLDKALCLNSTEYHWFFLTADEKIQSVCIIYHPKQSRMDGDKIFYIDYLASAYWNRDRPGHVKKFGNVGKILISYASYFATHVLGYRPGFCLHSLPTAEGFYKKLGMIEFEADAAKENLRYYEAPPQVADKLAGESIHV